MKKPKKCSKSQIEKMSDSRKKEYYKSAVEYYGMLKGQLKGFKTKGIIHPFFWLLVHILPVKVIMLNNIDWPVDGKPVIFSANHSNSNDFPVLIQSIRKHFFILADYTLINDTFVNLANQLNGVVYVDRKSKLSTTNAFGQCVEGVKYGYNMVVFPESTWNLTKSLPVLPRYWGDIRIAQETGAPIVPTSLVYSGRICLIKYGKKISVSKNDSLEEKDKEVYSVMAELRKEIEASLEYKKHNKAMDYVDWVKKNINSYKHFDVDYEMSCVRNSELIPQDELEQIKRIGEEMHPVSGIRRRLKYAKINYRFSELEDKIE